MLVKRPVFGMVWLSAAIIVLGLLTRWATLFASIPEGTLLSFLQLHFIHSKSAIYSISQLEGHLSDPYLWGLWGLLVAAYLFSIWKIERLNYLRILPVMALHLLAGALLSTAFDLLFFRGFQNSLQIDVAGVFNFNLTLVGFVLVAVTIYLLRVTVNRNWLLTSQYRLSPCNIPDVQISALPRGVDNIHIDVLLSNKFCKSSNLCIHNLIPFVVRDFRAGKRRVHISENQLKPLHDIFSQMMEETLRRAKDSGEKQLVELLVISVFKYIHEEVDRSVDAYVRQRTDAFHNQYQQRMTGEKDQKFVEYISRYKDDVTATTNIIIISALKEHRLLPFNKALKSFLGIKKSFSIHLIQAPFALYGHQYSDRALLDNYLLTAQLRKSDNHFYKIDEALSKIFQPYLLLLRRSDEGEEEILKNDDFVNERMEILAQTSIFMDSSNIRKLLDTEWTRENIEQAAKEGDRAKKRKLERHLQFQSSVFFRVEKELSKSPISRWLVASYQVKEILYQSSSDASPSLLNDLLVNSLSVVELEENAQKKSVLINRFPDMELIKSAWDVVHNGYVKFIHNNLLSMMLDFSRYRHDLQIECQLLQANNHIKLLTDKSDVQSSRANYTLHDFSILSEVDEQKGQVRSHIIIKADLRGSTQVTDKLVGLSLNPASHFERNFFTPVNELIESYGAEKVFIEGDAIILILNEHEGQKSNNHIASRACGLAAHILRVVAKQNKELKCYALPELELGIGIAYSHSSPRYLFDGEHRITISPAINRADRLSACAWSVREWREKQSASMSQVEVYQPSKSAEAVGEKAQKDMVFNLNGILIEDDVFEKLQKEVNLKQVQNRIPTMQDSKLFSLVFPDLAGGVHRMIVRKAPIKRYDQSYKVDKCPVVDNRFFYEVVYKKNILDQLRK